MVCLVVSLAEDRSVLAAVAVEVQAGGRRERTLCIHSSMSNCLALSDRIVLAFTCLIITVVIKSSRHARCDHAVMLLFFVICILFHMHECGQVTITEQITKLCLYLAVSRMCSV